LSDPYLIAGTGVLRNKLGILDPDHLDRQIDDLAIVEASYLFNEGPPVSPSLAGWRVVHKAMFGEVFDWAGDFRSIHIRKLDENGDPSGYFTAPERIEAEGRKAIRHLEAALRRATTDDLVRIADNLAEVYGRLNSLHPFREGNGRSQKVFFSAICKPVGIELVWSEIPVEEHNAAARLAMNGDPSLMKKHFRSIAKKADHPSLKLRRGTR
jgi:cell filamentation protein